MNVYKYTRLFYHSTVFPFGEATVGNTTDRGNSAAAQTSPHVHYLSYCTIYYTYLPGRHHYNPLSRYG